LSVEEPKSLESSSIIMPAQHLDDSMTLSSLRLPTPKASRSNLNISAVPAHHDSDNEDEDETESVSSDTSSFFDVVGATATTTGSESVRPDDDFDFISDTEDETGDEL
jgi:hypothetical protein